MKHLYQRAMAFWLSLLGLALGLLLLVSDPLLLQTVRYQVFDQYQRWSPRVYAPQPVRIIDIDEASLQRLGQWPWPRTQVAEMVQRLHAAEVAAIGFDVLFIEPDRTSPQALAPLWPLAPQTRQALLQLPDHDAVLAQNLADRHVVLGFSLQRERAARPNERTPAVTARFVWLGGGAQPQALHGFDSALVALDKLERQAAGNGALTFVPDADGVVRRVPLVLRLGDQLVPSLVTETLRVGLDARNVMLRSAEQGRPALEEVRIGDLTLPTTATGELWLHYTEPVPERYIPAWKLLNGSADPALLQGHLVLVGSSAQGLMDLRFNSLGRIMPGVEAHAQALEQALGGHFLTRPTWALGLEALLQALGTVLLVLLAIYARALWAAAAAALLIGAALWGGWWAFSSQGLLFNSVIPALVWSAAFVVASLAHHFRSEQQQRFIKQAFARYVSPNRVEYLVEHPQDLNLGGQRQTCSFVFTDLAGFTNLMEKTDPGDALGLLNQYLEQMIEIAFKHQGTLDRIVGDAVAIMFSAPVQQPDHPRRALRCALEMHAFASRYASELQARGIAFGHTRLGVHSGEVIVGNFGGKAIFDYRALGDPVNTASRLESANKHLGTRICVSGQTLADCPDLPARPIGRLVLKGKRQDLAVFEPLSAEVPGPYAPLDEYQAAYAALAQSSAEAEPLFAALAQRYPDDPLVRLHHQRLRLGESGDRLVLESK